MNAVMQPFIPMKIKKERGGGVDQQPEQLENQEEQQPELQEQSDSVQDQWQQAFDNKQRDVDADSGKWIDAFK